MIGRVARRIIMAFGVGRATMPSGETEPTQMVQTAFPGSVLGGQDVKELLSVQLFGFASALKAGADVVAAFLSGDRSKGVIIASNDQRYRPTGLLPGEAMIYDAFGHSIHLTAAGILSTGTWTHNGTFTATGDVVAGTTSLQNHLQSGVAAGGGESGPPVAGT